MATVLFATPHQDDECLSMGAAARAHLEAGHDVHVLLMTNGINSGARNGSGLDRPDFALARDDEYTRAVRMLGVPFTNIHRSTFRVPDGQLSVKNAEDILSEWLDEHPGAWVKTLTNRGDPAVQHADHRNAGQAAVNLLGSGVIVANGLRLYVEPYQLDAFRATNSGLATSTESASNVAIVKSALDQYKAQDAVGSKYGFGYKSVNEAFDLVRANPVSYYHLP
jgi:LmbE family N-acetylglucosaminyl deacetylase